jgi:polysaccharide chain length determinant protein (PEP-CTERM system associated)
MSVEFRQRSIDEYVQILNRRKWHIILPTLTVFLAVGWAVWGLPNIYASTTFITLKPPTISEKVAPSLTNEDLSGRLKSINQTVFSRSSLEPMIAKYNLLQSERDSGMPMELVINKLKRNTTVDLEKTENEKTAGFRITYRDLNPETAQKVTAELAAKYVSLQKTQSTQSAETTREFIDEQLANARASLDILEKQRLQIMMQNVETLPESAQGLIAQLEGLRKREETISKSKETLSAERGRLNDSIRALNSQARLIENFGEKETREAATQAARIEDTPAYAQLIQRRAELNSKLENLKKQYREKHPDIVQTQTDIDKVNEELEKLSKNTDRRIKDASQSSSRKAQLQKESLEIEKQKAESQIGQIDQQLTMRDEEMRQNSRQIAALESRINMIPNVKVALEGVSNQYESAKKTYDDILIKYNAAQQQVQRESNAQGETISIVDPANLPQSPANASKRPILAALGAGLGLALGLFLAVVFEIPRLFKIQNVEDAKHYTGLPVLASVPKLLTKREIFWKKGIHLLKVFAGIIIAVVSLPLLITALQMSRILERLN